MDKCRGGSRPEHFQSPEATEPKEEHDQVEKETEDEEADDPSSQEREEGERQDEKSRLKISLLDTLRRGVAALVHALATERDDKKKAE